MIFSRWDAGAGRYDYFEAPGAVGLNDDLPVPRMPAEVGGIGVPSVECGRPLPRTARYVGHGEFAEGLVAKPEYVELGASIAGGGVPNLRDKILWFSLGGVAVAAVWFAQKQGWLR